MNGGKSNSQFSYHHTCSRDALGTVSSSMRSACNTATPTFESSNDGMMVTVVLYRSRSLLLLHSLGSRYSNSSSSDSLLAFKV